MGGGAGGPLLIEGSSARVELEVAADTSSLHDFMDEVEKSCRRETLLLYEGEGKGGGPVPASLEKWLVASRQKVLGGGGHREKIWKKLWSQIVRVEHLFFQNEGVPALCMRCLTQFYIGFAQSERDQMRSQVTPLLEVWKRGREKHERLLRPQLGSPDVADDLCQLDEVEAGRSRELIDHIHRFRNEVVRHQIDHMKKFFDDVIHKCYKGLMAALDTTLQLEQLQVPPNTEVPKKHLTLKKLRKAQRIKEEVLSMAGGEDRSKIRRWPPVNMAKVADVARRAESMVPDLGTRPGDVYTALPTALPSSAGDKKTSKKVVQPSVAVDNEKPSLVPNGWINYVQKNSEVTGRVSSAHRLLISERDKAVEMFSDYLSECFNELKEHFDTLLTQEESWNQRWKKQVDMLRRGNL